MVNAKKYAAATLYAALLISTAAAPLALTVASPAQAEEKAAETLKDKKAAKRAKMAAKRAAAREVKKKAISSESMKTYTQAVNAAKTQNTSLQQQARAIRKEIIQVMVADTFDSQKYISKNAEIDALNIKMRANMTEAMASALAKYSKAERQFFAKRTASKHKSAARSRKSQ